MKPHHLSPGNVSKLMESFAAEYAKYFGRTGASLPLMKLLQSIHDAFDWASLLPGRVQISKTHLQAFQQVRNSLYHCLIGAGWPDPVQFPWVERTWNPQKAERDQAEYFCMIKRMKKQYQLAMSSGRWEMFCDLEAWEVSPVCIDSSILKWLPQFQRQLGLFHKQQTAVWQCFSVVSSFLHGAHKTFAVEPASLRKVGHSKAQRGLALKRGLFQGQVGSFASVRASALPQSGISGKLVRVTRLSTCINTSKVAAFLDLNKHLLQPREEDKTRRNPGGHCWHAVFVHHCSRCCVGPDASLERWFSLIHMIWDSGSNLSPDRVVSRLFLRDAHVSCSGGARDEALIQSISHVLFNSLKKRPGLTRCTQNKRRRLGLNPAASYKTEAMATEADRDATTSGRTKSLADADFENHFEYHAGDLQDQKLTWKKIHRPSNLDTGARQALQAASGAGNLADGGPMQALPYLAEDIRTLRKHRPPSNLQEKMNAWLHTEAAAAWQEKRACLWE